MNLNMQDALNLNDRVLIQAIIENYNLIDYGYITAVNADGTIDVTHATKPITMSGEVMNEVTTPGIELLTIAAAGFSLKWEPQKGDKVLLLALKYYVQKTGEITQAKETPGPLHYTRDTMKALPLCVFSEESKVTLEAAAGTLKIDTEKNIELNGNSKSFVTYAELNQALSQFATQLNAALVAATYVSPAGTPAVLVWAGGTPPSSINISAAETKTIKTGG